MTGFNICFCVQCMNEFEERELDGNEICEICAEENSQMYQSQNGDLINESNYEKGDFQN